MCAILNTLNTLYNETTWNNIIVMYIILNTLTTLNNNEKPRNSVHVCYT